MRNRERIDRDYLLKAENILVDAICDARRSDDNELIEALGKVCGALYKCRAICWPDD
jgi:hypothetical protein